MAKHTFGEWLGGYTNNDPTSHGKKFCVEAVTGAANRVSITRASKYISLFFEKLTRTISYTPSRTYGALSCVFGALSLALHLIMDYVGRYDTIPNYVFIIGCIMSVIGIPFLVSDKPLSIALQNNVVTDFVFFEFFCIRRMHRSESAKGISVVFGIIFGIVLAVIGVFVPLWIVALAIAALVYLFLTFLSPEFSFFSIFIIMPYLSFDKNGIFLAVLVAVTLVSYARKVALGKRVYYFEQYDLALFIMLFCILISGVFVKGVESFVSSVVMILLGMGYILASSLVANRRLADCLTNAVIISSLPVSVIAIVESVLSITKEGIKNFEGARATFKNPYTLATFLIVALCFSVYFVDVRRNRAVKVLYTVITLIIFVALFFTTSIWAIFTLLIGLLAFLIQKARHSSGLLLLILSVFAYALLFIPGEYIEIISQNPITNVLGFSDSMQRWHTSFAMLRDNLFIGVGIGEDSFIKEIGKYSIDFSYSDSGNFLLEIACEAGIFSLFAFVMIYLIRVRHRGIYQPYVANSGLSKISLYTTVLTVMMMVYGAFSYIWADMTTYYLFWCVFGLGSATLRGAKQEFDDRVAYFSDGSAEDSSSIDISIR